MCRNRRTAHGVCLLRKSGSCLPADPYVGGQGHNDPNGEKDPLSRLRTARASSVCRGSGANWDRKGNRWSTIPSCPARWKRTPRPHRGSRFLRDRQSPNVTRSRAPPSTATLRFCGAADAAWDAPSSDDGPTSIAPGLRGSPAPTGWYTIALARGRCRPHRRRRADRQ